MLENLSADEGLPSQKLIQDLRTLCGLAGKDLSQLASAFDSLPEDASEEDATDALLEKLRGITGEPERLGAAANVAIYVWGRWAARRLTKAQIISDLKGIVVDEDQRAAVGPLLDAMERKIESLRRHMVLGLALGTGTPRIKSATCVVDARAIFKSQTHDKELGHTQPYFDFDRMVPVVILEMVSELNGEKATHSFLMTEKQLAQMSEVLDRAGQRLKIVKKQLGLSADEGSKKDGRAE
jgi:hypothetical protein